MTDSQRSPRVAITTAIRPSATPTHQSPSSIQTTRLTPTATQNARDPAKPSQDFLGEITGAIGCRPNSTPAM